MQSQEMQDERVSARVSNVADVTRLTSSCLAFFTFGKEFLSLTEINILVH